MRMNTRDKEDRDLLLLLSQGDKWAYESIYRRYVGDLLRYAASKLGDPEDAADIVQDIFTDLWTKREKLEITHNLRTYLFTAVKYLVINRIRKKLVRASYADIQTALHIPISNLEAELAAKDLAKHIDSKIAELPVKTQNIFNFSRKQFKKNKDIAGELDISEQTVKNQISIAIKHIRNGLAVLLGFLLFFLS